MKEHKFPGILPKKVNWEQGIFESGGTFYYVNIETMSYERLRMFAQLLPVVIYGRKYNDLAMFIHGLRKQMIQGDETLKETFFSVASQLTNWSQHLLDNASDDPAYIDDILYFCGLMINEAGEDTNKIDEVIMNRKLTNWKSDLDILQFVFFSKMQVPKFKEILQELSIEATKNGGNLIKNPIRTD